MNIDQAEINLIVKALRYTTECGYGLTLCQEEVDEYTDMKRLIQRLDPQPVKKEGWMVVYEDGSKTGLFDTKSNADEWVRHSHVVCKVVKVTWEE